MLSWLAPLLVFGLVIFVHELGHFLAAKWAGVYAPRFSIGFGPALWRRRRGETEYVVAAIPLGGYVRMASREDEASAFIEGGAEVAAVATTGASAPVTPDAPSGASALGQDPTPKGWDPEAMMPFGPKPVPENRWFESKPLGVRIGILSAGVIMNALLAWTANVTTVAAYGRPYLAPVVDSVVAGRPAAAAGMLAGDSVVAVNGSPVRDWAEVVDAVSARPGQEITLDVSRGGTTLRVRLTPDADTATDPATGERRRVGRVGLAPRLSSIGSEPVGFGEAIALGTAQTVASAAAIGGVLRGLFSGDVGVETLGGPVRIAQVSVEAAQGGLEPLLMLIAFISINLAILNLLPIPILDGGQILLNLAEAAKGSPFSPRARGYILRFGLAVIAVLVLVVTFNDIKALFGGIFASGG